MTKKTIRSKSKKLVVNQNLCIGCNTCPLICPNCFKLDEATYKAKVIKQPDEADIDQVQQAIDSCPVQAIRLQ